MNTRLEAYVPLLVLQPDTNFIVTVLRAERNTLCSLVVPPP